MDESNEAELTAYLEAAQAFADLVGREGAEPTTFRDIDSLPAPKEKIRIGICSWIFFGKSNDTWFHWTLMLDALRQYQPNIGAAPQGTGPALAAYQQALHALDPQKMPKDELASMLTQITNALEQAESRTMIAKEFARREEVEDAEFLRRCLGEAWREIETAARSRVNALTAELTDGQQPLEFVPVVSSTIEAVAYRPGTSTLAIRFSNKSEYEYAGVPEDAYVALLAAPSKGKYFAFAIKPRFVGIRTRAPSATVSVRAGGARARPQGSRSNPGCVLVLAAVALSAWGIIG